MKYMPFLFYIAGSLMFILGSIFSIYQVKQS